MLGKRLAVCAGFVRGEKACDVGTDHGYLAAELLLSGKCGSVIASDINEKPLSSAERTLSEKGVRGKAELILSDGLKNIPLDGVTDIIIAGMGGELIFRILSECGNIEALRGKNLILQPMTKAEFLRGELAAGGFLLKEEKAVSEGKHIYTVMNAEYDDIKREADELFCYMGKLDASDEEAREYLKRAVMSVKRAADGLAEAGDLAASAEKQQLAAALLQKIQKDNKL